MPDPVVYVSLSGEAHTLEIAAEALRSEADRRLRVAVKFSGELEADRLSGKVKDVRQGAVQVQRTLAEADALQSVASQLEQQLQNGAGPASPVAPAAAPPADVDVPPDPATDPDVAAAQAALGIRSSLDDDTVEPVLDPAAVPPADDAGAPSVPA